jgi:cyanophycinase-like exopeptidase
MEEPSILKLLCSAPSKARIEIITTGSEFPNETFACYEDFFRASDVAEIRMLDINSRSLKSEDMKRIETATSIYISGGN